MGTVGREIIGHDVQDIINDLNRGLAPELHDAYRYQLLARLAAGMDAPEVAEWFADTAQDEWRHLGLLMERIVSLGGRPFARPAQAEQHAYAPYKEPPQDPTDLVQMLHDSLEGERAAIRFYRDLFTKTQHTDPVTARLALEALADEVGDEDELERFLAGARVAARR